MKLDLDKKNLTRMVLTASGPITRRDAQILRAGFKNLLGTARNAFLIDLSQAQVEPDAEVALLETQMDALVKRIRLVIVGSNPRICQVEKAKDADDLMASVVRLDKVLVPQLYELRRALEARRQEALTQLRDKNPENNPKIIARENERLKSRVQTLETQIGVLSGSRSSSEPAHTLPRELRARLQQLLEARKVPMDAVESAEAAGEAEEQPRSEAMAEATAAAVDASPGPAGDAGAQDPIAQLTPAELKEQFQTVETEIQELEKEVATVIRLKGENRQFKMRMRSLQQAVFGLIALSAVDGPPAVAERRHELLERDLATL